MRMRVPNTAIIVLLVFFSSLAAGSQLYSQTTEQPKNRPTARLTQIAGLQYAWIPPGTFQMGCSPGDADCYDEEGPSHPVKISKGFWIGQTAVTVGAYKRFTQSNGKSMPPEPNFFGRALNSGWDDDQKPVADVTWDEARDYCTWVGGRLPTEAEWEYAARGGSTQARYGPLDEIAWYADNSGQQYLDSARLLRSDEANATGSVVTMTQTLKRLNENGNAIHEVGQKPANGFGLYDTLGNVAQWVNDWYDQNYYQNSPSQDPQGPSSGKLRVLRGGSWFDLPGYIRVSYRHRFEPGARDSGGMTVRCVREVASP
jgi:formylglycine-generating enzyme required for sulfatase activity